MWINCYIIVSFLFGLHYCKDYSNFNVTDNHISEYIKGYSTSKFTIRDNNSRFREFAQDIRPKRGALHLYNMVSCATGCNPLMYKGYGCFCGFLGSGQPVDGIDRCCKIHDWCYNQAKCPMYLEYVVPYFWKCWYNKPYCAIDHGKYGGPGSCADRLCECDRALSECFKRFPCPSYRVFCRSSPFRFLQNALMGLT